MKPYFTFLPYFHIVVLAIIPFALTLSVDPVWYLVWVAMHILIVTFGVQFTFHRLLTHQSFKTSKLVERIGTLVGCLGVTGSSIGWCVVHMQHHIHSDTDKDPHSPKNVGRKIMLGFFNYDVLDKRTLVTLKHLIYDPFHIFVEKYYPLILGTWWILCYAFFGLNGLLFLGILPSCTSGVATMVSNYFLHKTDGKILDNSFLLFPLCFGEAAHEYHHKKPYNPYAPAYKWIDPTNYYIKALRTDK